MLLLSNNKGKLMEIDIKEEARLHPKQDLNLALWSTRFQL